MLSMIILQTQYSSIFRHVFYNLTELIVGGCMEAWHQHDANSAKPTSFPPHIVNFDNRNSTSENTNSRCSHNDVPSYNSQAHASLLPCMSPPSCHPTTTTSGNPPTPTIHKPTSPILQHPLAHPSSITIPLTDSRPVTSRPPSTPTLHPPNIHLADIPIQTRRISRSENLRYVIRDSVDVTSHQDGTIPGRD